MNLKSILLTVGIIVVLAFVADLVVGYLILKGATNAVIQGIATGRPTDATSVSTAIGNVG